MYKRGSLFRLFYFINFTAELKRRPDRRYDCESLTAASRNRCQVLLYLYFFYFVLFHLFSLLVRDGSLDLVGGGGGCSQALRTYFFRANSLCKIFFFGCITFAGIFFNTTLGLFLCI